LDLKIDEAKNIAYIKMTGQVSSVEVLSAFDTAVSAENYTMGMRRLWDFREVDLSAINSETIRQMAKYSLSFPPGINDVKVAFVTAKTLEYGLSRMFEMFSADAKSMVRVFKTMKEAENWMMEEERR
jgi:L-ribulose-5-phosphate 3-epimerase UlaE